MISLHGAAKTFAKDESGATAIEYGLIASMVALAIVAPVATLGDELTATYELIADYLT